MPGIGQLDELLDQARAVGSGFSCTDRGAGATAPYRHGLTAYRIVQESLTNIRKHAGRAATANVILRYLRARSS